MQKKNYIVGILCLVILIAAAGCGLFSYTSIKSLNRNVTSLFIDELSFKAKVYSSAIESLHLDWGMTLETAFSTIVAQETSPFFIINKQGNSIVRNPAAEEYLDSNNYFDQISKLKAPNGYSSPNLIITQMRFRQIKVNPLKENGLTFFVHAPIDDDYFLVFCEQERNIVHTHQHEGNFFRKDMNTMIGIFSGIMILALLFGIAYIVLIYRAQKQDEKDSADTIDRLRHSNEIFANLSTALCQDYSAIYYINIISGHFGAYSTSNYFSQLDLPTSGEDFFGSHVSIIPTIVYKDDVDYVMRHFTKENILSSIEKHKRTSFTFRLMVNGKPIYHILKAIRPANDDKHIVIGVVDVSERLQRESDYEAQIATAEAKRKQSELEMNKKLHEAHSQQQAVIRSEHNKSRMFANLNHDIRIPLNAINGFSELLRADIPIDDHTRKQYLDTICLNCDILLNLVNNVLDLSKLEEGRMKFIYELNDFNDLCHQSIEAFRLQAEKKGLKMMTDIQKNLPLIEIDSQRINQILFNLINNAIKFTEQGYILLNVTFAPDDDKKGVLTFAVNDTGRGISQEDLDNIAAPYVQCKTDDQKTGTGLGLAICKALVKNMNGKMTVKSEVGLGSTFTITLNDVAYFQA